jgi:hypothetical protein
MFSSLSYRFLRKYSIRISRSRAIHKHFELPSQRRKLGIECAPVKAMTYFKGSATVKNHTAKDTSNRHSDWDARNSTHISYHILSQKSRKAFHSAFTLVFKIKSSEFFVNLSKSSFLHFDSNNVHKCKFNLLNFTLRSCVLHLFLVVLTQEIFCFSFAYFSSNCFLPHFVPCVVSTLWKEHVFLLIFHKIWTFFSTFKNFKQILNIRCPSFPSFKAKCHF